MNWSSALLAASATAFAVSVAVAQAPGGAPPPPPSNLKVLPASIPRPELMNIMRGFSTGLGVRCTHCHVAQPGDPTKLDFASDAKKEKEVARAMLRMVHRINADLGVKDFKDVKVTCYTCHRGAVKPAVWPPAAPPGVTPAAGAAPKPPSERG